MRKQGFTLLETLVTAGIIMVLMGSALAVVGDMTYFVDNQDSRTSFDLAASTALAKLNMELRETGTTTIGGIPYPYTMGGGSHFVFVKLADPPCTYDGSTDLVWNPVPYTVKVQDGELGIWQGGLRRVTLCRNVAGISMGLVGRKITVDLKLADVDKRGAELAQVYRRVTVMRN